MKAVDDIKGEASDRWQSSRQEAREAGSEFAGIAREFGVLAQKEAQLARAEAGEQVAVTVRALVYGAIAAVLAVLGIVFIALALHFVYDTAMASWLAALLTALTLFVAAGVLALMARERLRRLTFKPERTMESLREDVRWARTRLNFNER
jgi:type IV secretory pathway VirB2 component (pilin)